MQQPELSITRDVLLVGGGHAHALVLRKWAMAPLPGARLTLVNPAPAAPYTGMLPGFVAGHYDRGALDIDMVRLARAAGARLVIGRASDISCASNTVTLDNGRNLRFDALSLDIGIHAPGHVVMDPKGALVPIKPMDQFADAWQTYLARALSGEVGAHVTLIGAGVGGVEVALAIAHALRARADRQITLIDAATALGAQSAGLRKALLDELAAAGVACIEHAAPKLLREGVLEMADGRKIVSDFTISAAGAAPYDWLSQTDLPLIEGYVAIEPTLRARGSQNVFAAGDCAHMTDAPRPKAGVFAVRAAPILFDNLRATVAGGNLRSFQPQRDYLKIVSLGDKRAMAEKWRVRPSGRAMWGLKDRIDRKFMDQFTGLAPMAVPKPPEPRATDPDGPEPKRPLCAGCGAKVAPQVLRQVLKDLPPTSRADVRSGPGDDAAVLSGPDDLSQVITTDHLRAFTHDPHLMARIVAVHALGDIWAMGAKAQAVLPHLILPRTSKAIQADMMAEIMAGAAAIFGPLGAAIVGGHSSLGTELNIGFTVTGLCKAPIGQSAARPGDALLLCKPIGSGTLLAAEMALQAQGHWIASLWSKMAEPQGVAADILAPFAHAMTDVTGFGLAGHLDHMARASNLRACLDVDAVPFYPGAIEMAKSGIRSSLYRANCDNVPALNPTTPRECLLFDPQTAGGLLAAISPDNVAVVEAQMEAAGLAVWHIGAMRKGQAGVELV